MMGESHHDDSDGATATEAAVQLLRRDIVTGALTPASKLKIRELKERYGIGASPMREALAQLSAQGLVQQSSQKGFRVPPLSAAELLDITRSRQLIEVEALRLAITHGDASWEDEIVASFHLLEHYFRRVVPQPTSPNDEFETRHARFHHALIAACPLHLVRSFCETLYEKATRYRLMMRTDYGFSNDCVIAEHRTLMEAVLSRDVDGAVREHHAHIQLTADILLDVLAHSPEQGDDRFVGQ
ncbi:FCD domain-containing protein [Roseiarcaceae bacterium H3SJ34-1]|uniref:GntR family transcriptional regulator n=1 Tax=Terripilifer ovatus TaxID=3032367 RepID=UPI003AB93549|nr:FCD domain-containing protein [Roseiarcaceae bacterium H3SJ34-1]